MQRTAGAKGQPVIHPYNRTRVQIGTPLDFLVVSDHAEMLGVMKAVRERYHDKRRSWLDRKHQEMVCLSTDE